MQGLVVQTAGRRYEDGSLEAFRIRVRELADDRAAHRVPDQRHRLDLTVVEESGRCVRQVVHVEGVDGPPAAAEPGQVRDQGVELVGQPFCCWQQVAAGKAESVQVHHDRGVGRLTAIRGRRR